MPININVRERDGKKKSSLQRNLHKEDLKMRKMIALIITVIILLIILSSQLW